MCIFASTFVQIIIFFFVSPITVESLLDCRARAFRRIINRGGGTRARDERRDYRQNTETRSEHISRQGKLRCLHKSCCKTDSRLLQHKTRVSSYDLLNRRDPFG